MKKFLKAHPETILVGLAMLFVGVLGAYFFWGVGALLTDVHTSLKIPSAGEKPAGFDLEAARGLGLKLEQ